jgi:hypothetical protein
MHMNSFMGPRFDSIAAQVSIIALGLIAPVACVAQLASTPMGRTSASEILARFESYARTGNAGGVPDIVTHPENYPATMADSVIAGLETLAWSDKPDIVRGAATFALILAGSDKRPIPGLFDRVVRLYQNSHNDQVRVTVIRQIAEGHDHTRGIEFLKSTATAPAPPDLYYAPRLAAETLSFMGAEGRAILTALDAKGSISDSRARDYVKWFLTTQ